MKCATCADVQDQAYARRNEPKRPCQVRAVMFYLILIFHPSLGRSLRPAHVLPGAVDAGDTESQATCR